MSTGSLIYFLVTVLLTVVIAVAVVVTFRKANKRAEAVNAHRTAATSLFDAAARAGWRYFPATYQSQPGGRPSFGFFPNGFEYAFEFVHNGRPVVLARIAGTSAVQVPAASARTRPPGAIVDGGVVSIAVPHELTYEEAVSHAQALTGG